MIQVLTHVILLFSLSSYAGSGVSGAAGAGGTKPEQRIILENLGRQGKVLVTPFEGVSTEGKGVSLENLQAYAGRASKVDTAKGIFSTDSLNRVYINLREVTEFTLQDGTVIRAEELLENLKK